MPAAAAMTNPVMQLYSRMVQNFRVTMVSAGQRGVKTAITCLRANVRVIPLRTAGNTESLAMRG